MPYQPNGSDVPESVPADKREQWAAVWNDMYSRTGSEASAFAAAWAAIRKGEAKEAEMSEEEKQTEEAMKEAWTVAYQNDLPDSAFLYVEPGGEKDPDGKTVPRSLRHFPVRDASGAVDAAHVRNALGRIPQSNVPPDVKQRCIEKARAMLEEINAQQGKQTPTDMEKGRAMMAEAQAMMAEAEAMMEKDKPAAQAMMRRAQAMMEQARVMMGEMEAAEPSGKMLWLHLAVKKVDADTRIIEGFASTPDLDRQGEVVTQQALERHMAEFMDNPIMLYNHGMDKDIGHNPIGKILEFAFRGGRLWIRAQIAKGVDYVEERIWPLIQQGVLNALSIGAPAGQVKKRGNQITDWPLAEISVVSVPANARATFSLVKSLATGTDLENKAIAVMVQQLEAKAGRVLSRASRERIKAALDALRELTAWLDEVDATEREREAGEIFNKASEEVEKMEADEIKGLVDSQVKAALETQAAATKAAADAKAAEEARFNEEVEKRVKAEIEKKAAGDTGRKMHFDTSENGGMPAPSVFKVFSPYDRLDTLESCIRYELCKKAGMVPSEKWLRSLAVKAVEIAHRKVATSFYGDGRPAIEEPALDLNTLVPWAEAVDAEEKSEGKDPVTRTGVKQLLELVGKASEVAYSTYSGYGDQWVPTLMNAALWEQIRLEAGVLPLFEQFDMPSQPYDYPTESTDPVVYKIPETTDEAQLIATGGPYTDSKVATAKITFSAGKIGPLSYWSEELDEDSIIRIQPAYRGQYGRVMAHGIDYVLLNGDETTDSSNISDNQNASIAATFRCLALDGLRHEPLVTTTTDKSAISAALQIDDFKTVKALMGTAGKYSLSPDALVIICDPAVAHNVFTLDEHLTVNNYGPNATILRGQVRSILGSPLIPSEDFVLTDASGYINTSSNTKGSFIVVRRDGIKVGWRRRPRIKVGEVPMSDAYYILGVCRLDIGFFAAGMVALGYNITV